MPLPLYSEYRGGFDTGVIELCTDYITIALPNKKQADDGGYFYNPPIIYGELPTSSVTNSFASTPANDPFFAQPDNELTTTAYFRCQFIISQRKEMGGEGNSLIVAGKYVLPAAPWVDYQEIMNQYNYFYKRSNTDFKNPKGFEKLVITAIAPKHDLNRNITHYEISVAQ